MVFKIKWLTEVTEVSESYLTTESKRTGVFQIPLHLKHLLVINKPKRRPFNYQATDKNAVDNFAVTRHRPDLFPDPQ